MLSVRGISAFAAVLALACALGASGASASEGTELRCDGKDLAFFMEMKEAGWVGYGETWDLETCGEGREIYATGATRAWQGMRPQWSRLAAPNVDVRFYSTIFPLAAFGSLGGIFGLAWLMAFFQRRRRVTVTELECPSCGVAMPVHLDDPHASHFCPGCGVPCVVAADGAPAPA
jgi:hypothetical protein